LPSPDDLAREEEAPYFSIIESMEGLEEEPKEMNGAGSGGYFMDNELLFRRSVEEEVDGVAVAG